MREHPVDQVILRHRASRPLTWLIAVALTALPGVAAGHAKLVGAEPADGAVVASAPERLVLRFDGEVEARFHRFTLVAPDGTEVALQATLRAQDATTYEIDLPTLGPGAWAVTWSVVSRDSHRVGGTLRFVVAPAPSPTSAPTAP